MTSEAIANITFYADWIGWACAYCILFAVLGWQLLRIVGVKVIVTEGKDDGSN